MSRILPIVRRAFFALATVAALGFGATQAVAESGPQPDRPRVCDPRCKPDCGGFGGELRHWSCLCCG